MLSFPDDCQLVPSPLVSSHPVLAEVRAFHVDEGSPSASRERAYVLVHDVELRLEFEHQKGIVQQFLRRNGRAEALRKVGYRQLTSQPAFRQLRDYIEQRFGRGICGSGYALVSLEGLDRWFSQSRTFRGRGETLVSQLSPQLRDFERKVDRLERIVLSLGPDELPLARSRVERLLEVVEGRPAVPPETTRRSRKRTRPRS